MEVYTRITNNKTTLASKKLNRISIHCFVGQVTAKQGVDYFATTDRQASSNYVVGYDGSIGLSVDEKDRAWCTSSASNDKQAITIEVASAVKDPYEVTDAAYAALLDLITDICQRWGKTKVIWNENKDEALAYVPAENEVVLTVHRWFAAKACPGQYLLDKHAEIAATVTDRLTQPAQEEEEEMTQEKFNEMMDNYLEYLNTLPPVFEQEALDWAKEEGLLLGDENGNLMPRRFMTRGEFMTVLKRYADKQ